MLLFIYSYIYASQLNTRVNVSVCVVCSVLSKFYIKTNHRGAVLELKLPRWPDRTPRQCSTWSCSPSGQCSCLEILRYFSSNSLLPPSLPYRLCCCPSSRSWLCGDQHRSSERKTFTLSCSVILVPPAGCGS